MTERVANSGKARPVKDKEGRNVKRHLATFKYYVKKLEVEGHILGNQPADEKQKMYITADGHRIEGAEAFKAAKEEQKLPYSQVMERIQRVGVKDKDP